jgi:hypothetical protein
MTISEELFERFCQENGIRSYRVPPKSKEKIQTPDYDLFLNGQKIVAEVKQFDPNTKELRLLNQLQERGWTDAFGDEPGHRVRKKIADAVPQLRQRSEDKYPALLVLYNNVSLTSRHADSYSIKTAMYGLEVIDLEVTNQPSQPIAVIDRRFGPKRKVGSGHNTTLSAVASLYQIEGHDLRLDFFHNIFAKVRFDPDWLRVGCVRHFSLQEKVGLHFQEWVAV